LWSDQTQSGINLSIANAPGDWANGASDPMFCTYTYVYDGDITVTLTGVPAGAYDLYLYGHGPTTDNSVFSVTSPSNSQGTLSTTPSGTAWQSTTWAEGVQYVVFRGLSVSSGQPLTVEVQVDSLWYALIAGLQLVPISGGGSGGGSSPLTLLNMDFGGMTSSPETGPAAAGALGYNFWNYLGWQVPGPIGSLVMPDGLTPSGVSLAANNLPGAWDNGSTEPMYDYYIYAPYGQSGALTYNGLPTGTYNVYAYSFDGNFALTVGGVSQGTQTTTYNYPTASIPPWTAGLDYALWSNVAVTNGQPMVLTVSPGRDGYAVISGMQIAYSATWPSITLSGLTNDATVGGVVTLPVEVAAPSGNIAVISLDDSGVSVASYSPPFQMPSPLLQFDTTQLSNGVHNISAYAMVINPGTGLEDGSQIIYEGESATNSVNVYNEIAFPNYMSTFGELSNSLAVVAESGHPNAQWQLDIYGSAMNYIGSIEGTATDGFIGVAWNLVGPNGALHTDSAFEANLTTAYMASPVKQVLTTKAVPTLYRVTDPWPGPGGWVIANQQAWQNLVGADDLDTATDGFVALARGLGLPVSPTTSDPSSGQAYRIPYGAAAAPAAWTAFRAAIYNPTNRNLFYLGHGDDTGLGAATTGTSRFIPATEIGARLGTWPLTPAPQKYRFVWLDGCSTAAGNLPLAFGISKKQNVPSSYCAAAGLRPSAFAGWSRDQTIGFTDDAILEDQAVFVQYFLAEWSNGYGVQQAFQRASWYPGCSLIRFGQLSIFGFWGLTANQYNR
jgi:hypothetical protein